MATTTSTSGGDQDMKCGLLLGREVVLTFLEVLRIFQSADRARAPE